MFSQTTQNPDMPGSSGIYSRTGLPPCPDQRAMTRSYRDAELGSPTANGPDSSMVTLSLEGKSVHVRNIRSTRSMLNRAWATEVQEMHSTSSSLRDRQHLAKNSWTTTQDGRRNLLFGLHAWNVLCRDILRNLHLLDMQSYGTDSTNVDQASQPFRPLPLVQSLVVTREKLPRTCVG
jgi:hypothetical protein